jgi:hypothetical protein
MSRSTASRRVGFGGLRDESGFQVVELLAREQARFEHGCQPRELVGDGIGCRGLEVIWACRGSCIPVVQEPQIVGRADGELGSWREPAQEEHARYIAQRSRVELRDFSQDSLAAVSQARPGPALRP